MTKKIRIKIHSFVDVITNSSTELFITNNRKTIDQVKDILEEIIDHYNDGVEKRLYEESEKLSINDFLVYIYTKEKYDNRSKGYDWDYEKKKNIGKIMIEGAEDNIIPYEIFDMIERVFKAEREYLG